MSDAKAAASLESMAKHLAVLASPVRLSLLHELRDPRRLSELRLRAAAARTGLNPERTISRQAVFQHLRSMTAARLVHRIQLPDDEGTQGYVLNHERIFSLLDELWRLVKLSPRGPQTAEPQATAWLGSDGHPPVHEGPRLVVTYGQEEGRTYSLTGRSRWLVGRGTHCDIRLGYDPYASAEHSTLSRRDSDLFLADRKSRNGTRVNWVRLPPQGARRLEPGDVVGIGRSLLVFQPGPVRVESKARRPLGG